MSYLPRPSLDLFLTLLSATGKGSSTYLCREDPSPAAGTEVQFREGETQARDSAQLASRADIAAPEDALYCKQEPRGQDRKRLPGALLFVLPGAMSPGLQKGKGKGIRPVELQPVSKGVSAIPQAVGSHPSLACCYSG